MSGRKAYREGLKLWLAGEKNAALAAFNAGKQASADGQQVACSGFVQYLTGENAGALTEALQCFASAEAMGFSDLHVVFAMGHLAWQLLEKEGKGNNLQTLLLKQLACSCLRAAQTELPGPVLCALERHYGIVVGYLAAQVEYQLNEVKWKKPTLWQEMLEWQAPEKASELMQELGFENCQEPCRLQRLLIACIAHLNEPRTLRDTGTDT